MKEISALGRHLHAKGLRPGLKNKMIHHEKVSLHPMLLA